MTQQSNVGAKRILLVDDDIIVLRIYRSGLEHLGYQVETAPDGLAAIQSIRKSKPDLVVLDLMMPKMSGVDVLKFIRSTKELKSLPVVVLSNAYMDEMAHQAAEIGAEKALLKAGCTPARLGQTLQELLKSDGKVEEGAPLLAAPTHRDAPQEKGKSVVGSPGQSGRGPEGLERGETDGGSAPTGPHQKEANPKAELRWILKESSKGTGSELKELFDAFARAQSDSERAVRIQNLYRKVHFITAAGGMAESPHLATLAGVTEALLFELAEKPSRFSLSALRTLGDSIGFLTLLLSRLPDSDAAVPPSKARALVVDDDALSNRLVVSALRNAQLQVQSLQDSRAALEWLKNHDCELVLLDIEMPGMDGFELCKQFRALPNHRKTPVIFVSVHDDEESLDKSIQAGAADLIPKPVFPMELAVKAILHLLKAQLR
jgi:CheY-like chemotaxis protein